MSGFTGTARLTRLALRRDRVTLPAWLVGMTVFLAATTAMFVHSLATPADSAQEAALSTNNPGLRVLGLTSGASVGGATMLLALTAACLALAAVGWVAIRRRDLALPA